VRHLENDADALGDDADNGHGGQADLAKDIGGDRRSIAAPSV
jgi:hypothetical protein